MCGVCLFVLLAHHPKVPIFGHQIRNVLDAPDKKQQQVECTAIQKEAFVCLFVCLAGGWLSATTQNEDVCGQLLCIIYGPL